MLKHTYYCRRGSIDFLAFKELPVQEDGQAEYGRMQNMAECDKGGGVGFCRPTIGSPAASALVAGSIYTPLFIEQNLKNPTTYRTACILRLLYRVKVS